MAAPSLRIGSTDPHPGRTDHNLASTLIAEFPCRPHWTKNSREVLSQAVKNLDPGCECCPSLSYFVPESI